MLTDEKKQDNAHSHSGVRVVNVEVSDDGHVVIGVRIVQCYHAIMANSEFSTFGPNFNLLPISTCSQFQLVVRLYGLIVTFPCSFFLHTFAPRKHVI